jgi:GT2 family glycosyltransferase/glycosyltransferase involved in cell wall biosynthesis
MALKINSIVAYTTNSWESPLASLRVTGPAELSGMRLIKGNENDRIHPERVLQGDLVVIQRDFPRYGKAYREIRKLARENGKPVVFDLDDLLLELPEDHPDRISLYYDEALLPMLQAIIEADLVTASSEPLCSYLRMFNPQVSLLPNYLDDRFWRLASPSDPGGEKEAVVIGFMGGDSHTADLAWAAPAIMRIAESHSKKVVFRFMGARPPVELISLPNVTWTGSETFDYARFADQFSKQDYDICIAPLRDNLFNRCKSPIKFFEYSALGAPGVYSNLEPYSCVIQHRENGLLASNLEEWEEHLLTLIDSPNLRLQMGKAALECVRSNWLLSQNASKLRQGYQQAFNEVDKSLKGRKPETETLLRILEQAQDFERKLRAREQAAEYKAGQIVEEKQEKQRLASLLELIEQEKDALKYQLNEIEDSRSWRLLMAVGKVRSQPGSIPGAVMKLAEPLARVFLRKPAPVETPIETKPVETTGGLHIETASGNFDSSTQGAVPGKYDVIVLPVMDWNSRVQRPQQLAMQFANAGHRVFYLNTAFDSGPHPSIRQVQKNIFEMRLPSPRPLNLYKEAMDDEVRDSFFGALTSLQQVFGISHAVCMVDLPFWTPLALKMRSKYGWKVVYDCMDHHQGFTTNEEAMLSLEEKLARESDLILATSQILLEEISRHNPNCLLVPNGVAFDHFRYPTLSRPAEVFFMEKPIIGYYGAIADWFDSELVRELALARPEWNFVLIGSTLYADLEPLQGLPNVVFLGEKPYEELPPYLHAFDAAIIPFKKTPLTEATNPVKLFEYLSAGKPVVATRLEELGRYADFARLASTAEEWLASLENALVDSSPGRVKERVEFARRNTWAERFASIQGGIVSLYPKVSIIVLTYNNLDYNRLCLNSIFDKTDYPNYEVIVVDNSSTDGTREYLMEFAAHRSSIHLILNEKNEGFARGNNQGAAAASGELLVFLNNDTVVTGDWLTRMVPHLEDLDVGLAGPVTNWSGNETRIEVDYISINQLDAFAERYTSSRIGKRFEVRMLAFLCVAMRRSLFEEVGPLDESFGTGMFEDDDYALRVRAKGYRIVCMEDVFVHHWGRASFSQLDQEKYKRLFEENRRKFENKWGLDWDSHQNR